MAAVTQPGIDIVEGAWHADWDAERAAAGSGRDELERLFDLAGVFFGPVKHAGRQRRVRANAARHGHCLPVLDVLRGVLRRVKNKNDAWRIMEELSAQPVDAKQMAATARRKIQEARPAPAPQPGVIFRRSAEGLWSMRLIADAGLVADIKAQVRTVEDARAVFTGGGDGDGTGDGAGVRASVTTNVVLNLQDFGHLVGGQDAADITVQLTNGAVISGAELVTRAFEQVGYVGVFDPVAGPVNCYRDARLASWKQRRLALMEHPVCAWPGCLAGADECQVHHLQSWDSGGPTNAANLATLCPHHNGANEDGPGPAQTRGRMARVGGRVVWIPPERVPA
ncbi:HNH endonuclease signature motif containing protein [Corynebacterium sp. LK2537]|uniref:HNH endonuclease signature motif containing protein n=1 Tax=Corynebacterium sp. LK2537 TaxID=3110471 RepID=UPI0034CFDBD5